MFTLLSYDKRGRPLFSQKFLHEDRALRQLDRIMIFARHERLTRMVRLFGPDGSQVRQASVQFPDRRIRTALTHVALLMVLMLGACASAAAPSSPKPANWQQAVAAAARQAYFDPYSIRDVTISAPVPASGVFDGVTPIPQSGWMVCLRANAKNRMGAYTGQRVTGFLFSGERVVSVIHESDAAAIGYHCGADFQPFKL